MKKANSRRKFIEGCFRAGAGLLSGVMVLMGCGKSDNTETQTEGEFAVEACDDLTNVSENDIALRQKFAYVNESPIPDNQCNNCNLYLPPKVDEKCGACMLFKGPVFASGYCTYWAPKI